jgi:hypothetical protein
LGCIRARGLPARGQWRGTSMSRNPRSRPNKTADHAYRLRHAPSKGRPGWPAPVACRGGAAFSKSTKERARRDLEGRMPFTCPVRQRQSASSLGSIAGVSWRGSVEREHAATLKAGCRLHALVRQRQSASSLGSIAGVSRRGSVEREHAATLKAGCRLHARCVARPCVAGECPLHRVNALARIRSTS